MSTPFERLVAPGEADTAGDATTDDADTASVVPTGGSKRGTIDGEAVDLAEPRTTITFEDDYGVLSGEKGQPRPRMFWHAKRLGQTPPMQLIKNTVARQLTGGNPTARTDGEGLSGDMAAFADVVMDVYRGPHFQRKTLDNLIVDAIDDMLDTGWAYWELLPTADGEYPVGGFKPLPPLQIQHNVDDDSGALKEDPAYYQVPYTRSSSGGGERISISGEATPLQQDEIVVMREPLATTSDTLYGESLATKVREWLELIIDVDVHQKRHYNDSQLPAGFLHFLGNVEDDDLNEIEQDIKEAAGDPHELVTTTSENEANWIPVGGSVVDLDAIKEQTWYFKLVFAAAGLNLGELGIVEGSGFAKELPTLQRQIFKNITKPFESAIFDPQNADVVDLLADAVNVSDVPFRLGLERFDPVQEQVEREEAIGEYKAGAASLNELRGELGKEATELMVEVEGDEVNVADLPKKLADYIMRRDRPQIDIGDAGGDGEDMGV